MHQKGGVYHKAKVQRCGPRQGSGVTKAEKEAPSSQDRGLALQQLVVSPTVTSSLERSCRRLPYHQSGNTRCPLCLVPLC